MAGDWIKMRTDLDTDPAVIGIASSLGISEAQVVGLLWKVWSWANTQTRDGNAPSVTVSWLDRYAGAPGLAKAMEKVGWLGVSEAGISIPNFDHHNGNSGKTRALTKNRVDRFRRNDSVTQQALPEKRRVNPPTPQGGFGASRGRKGKRQAQEPARVTVFSATPEERAEEDRQRALAAEKYKNGLPQPTQNKSCGPQTTRQGVGGLSGDTDADPGHKNAPAEKNK